MVATFPGTATFVGFVAGRKRPLAFRATPDLLVLTDLVDLVDLVDFDDFDDFDDAVFAELLDDFTAAAVAATFVVTGASVAALAEATVVAGIAGPFFGLVVDLVVAVTCCAVTGCAVFGCAVTGCGLTVPAPGDATATDRLTAPTTPSKSHRDKTRNGRHCFRVGSVDDDRSPEIRWFTTTLSGSDVRPRSIRRSDSS